MFKIGETSFLEAVYETFDNSYDRSNELQDLHMEYIMENADPSERIICNGDTLLVAQEDGYLYEDFREDYVRKNFLS